MVPEKTTKTVITKKKKSKFWCYVNIKNNGEVGQ